MVRFARLGFIVSANQRGENGGQEHEHEGLNQADQDFQKVKWDRQQRAKDRPGPRGMLDRVGYAFEQLLPGENVSIKPETQRNGTESDGNEFEETHSEKDDDHHVFDE